DLSARTSLQHCATRRQIWHGVSLLTGPLYWDKSASVDQRKSEVPEIASSRWASQSPIVCSGSHQRKRSPIHSLPHSIWAAFTPSMSEFFARFNTNIVR